MKRGNKLSRSFEPLSETIKPLLKTDLERVISKYLQLTNAALSVPILDRRKDLFSELRRALRPVLRALEKLPRYPARCAKVLHQSIFHKTEIEFRDAKKQSVGAR